MAVKLSAFTFSTKIPKWVHLRAYVSSLSCANTIQITPENDRNPPSGSELEVKIQFLKDKQLHPCSLIRVLDSTPDLNLSLKLLKWASLQKGFRHTFDTYSKIIWKLGMGGNLEEMECYCSEMVKERRPGAEESLVAVIDSFVKHNRLDEAIRVLKVMNSISYKPSVGVFNVLLGALVQEKRDFQSVLFVYKEMVKSGIVPTVETLNFLLEALFEAGRVDIALDQYRRMNKKGCSPNSKTFEVLISGLVAANRVDESIIILGEMFELECENGPDFYNKTIPLFCRENRLEYGIKLFRMMRGSKIVPESFIYEVLIQSLCENLNVNEALSILDDMMDNGVSPTDDVLVNIVNGYCELGKFSEAMQFLEEKHVTETNPHNALLQGYCDANNFLAAKGLFDNMFDRNIVDTFSWNIIIRFLSEKTWIDRALEYLCRMIISSFVPDSATYSALIIGKSKLRELDTLDLFHQVHANNWVLDSDSYAELVECLCLTDKIQDATQVFCYIASHRCPLRSFSFEILMKKLCLDGKVDRAIELLSLAYYSGTSCSTAIYNNLMLVLSNSGKASDLLVVLSRMLIDGCPLDVKTYSILIQSLSVSGRTKDCILLFNLMVTEDLLLPDSQALADIFSCIAKHCQLHMVMSAIDKLISYNNLLNSDMYNILINGLWKEGHRSEASRILDLMLEKGWVPDATTHGLLIGSVREEIGSKTAKSEDFILQDNISSILAEGLGKT